MPPQIIALPHVPALDGMRGVAVAGVLAFHGGYLVGGYLGVDLFFVLSGYLITSLLLRESIETSTIRLTRFWSRRARRLLPALFGLLVGVAVYVALWTRSYERNAIRAATLATVFYVANWQAIWANRGYWDLFTTPSPLQHTWSLAIEEQFYLVWPLLIVAALRSLRSPSRGVASVAPTVFALALGLALTSWIWMMVRLVPGDDPSPLYFGTDTRAGSILVGAALGGWLTWRGGVRGARARKLLEVLAIVAIAWLAFAWATVDGESTVLYRGGLAACALAVVAVIAACVHPTSGPVAAALSVAPLRRLGLISYGIYLWHWPVAVVMQIERAKLWFAHRTAFALQVALSIVLALVSYVLLEQPIRRRGLAAWGRGGHVLMPAAAGSVLLLVLAVTSGGETRGELAYEPATFAAPGDVALRTVLPEIEDDAPVGRVVSEPQPAGPIARPPARPQSSAARRRRFCRVRARRRHPPPNRSRGLRRQSSAPPLYARTRVRRLEARRRHRRARGAALPPVAADLAERRKALQARRGAPRLRRTAAGRVAHR